MKIIAIIASGTGGHIYPALSVAKEYINLGYKILWIGTPNGLEDKIINDPIQDHKYHFLIVKNLNISQ